MEKSAQVLPTADRLHAHPTPSGVSRARKAAACLFIPLALWFFVFSPSVGQTLASKVIAGHTHSHVESSQCVQPAPLFPSKSSKTLEHMDKFLSSPAFENATIARLSGAVRVPTQSFDDLGEIGEDKRWDVMYNFASYLKHTFPQVHSKLELQTVNTHGLVYIWEGSDKSLKPTLLMAHQDVVPVPDATVDAWTHPPFEGVYDGEYIWGRGSSDCKNQLIAIMETAELLLEAGFSPERTIIMPFGFDEEISGREGAGHLAPYILERFGKDSIAAIVDEGATFEDVWGTTFAKPGVGEKGYTDVTITIRMPGGHSSIPSDHTSIGVLSELISLIEAHPYKTYLDEKNPYLAQLTCGAAYSPDFPKKLKKLLGSHPSQQQQKTCKAKPDHLALEAAKAGPAVKYLMQTSQAVDVINGGVKVNALPERVSAIVNHRINVGENPGMVWKHLRLLAQPVAQKYNLTLNAFNEVKEAPLSISMSASDTTLNVAPISPTDEKTGGAYKILAGTTRALYGEDIVVAPGIMTGNTDTRYYWALTKNIFRFGPGYDGKGSGLGNIHTVDEKVSVKTHINAVKWFSLFVRNMDEADLE